jgi:hypothetical protein
MSGADVLGSLRWLYSRPDGVADKNPYCLSFAVENWIIGGPLIETATVQGQEIHDLLAGTEDVVAI